MYERPPAHAPKTRRFLASIFTAIIAIFGIVLVGGEPAALAVQVSGAITNIVFEESNPYTELRVTSSVRITAAWSVPAGRREMTPSGSRSLRSWRQTAWG